MEFHEKLQSLRKRRGMTQEELAEALFVSRTAISKWESGRGYPNIESLKAISSFFDVSIDDLLSGERLLSIAEKENRSNLRAVYDLLLGMVDLLSCLLIVLPLYPKTVAEYVYSVNLWMYRDISPRIYLLYWLLFLTLVLCGAAKMLPARLQAERGRKPLTITSMTLGVVTVLLLAMAGETYAVTLAFLLLLIKTVLLFQKRKRQE